MTLEDFAGEQVSPWPDNVPALVVFEAMRTQWRVGNGGVYGLDYNALPAVMNLVGVPRKKRSEIFADVRVMEDAALEQIHKK